MCSISIYLWFFVPHSPFPILAKFAAHKKESHKKDGSTQWTKDLNDSIKEILEKLTNESTPEESRFQNHQGYEQAKTENSKNSKNSNSNSSTNPDKKVYPKNFIPNFDTPGYDPNALPTVIGLELYRKYWDYTSRLICEMFNMGLLDKDLVLCNLVDLFLQNVF